MTSKLKEIITEIIGTFLLTFVALTTHNYLAIGSILAINIYLTGGTFNPAVAIAKMLSNVFSANDLVIVIVSQIIGAICAFYATKLI